MKSWFRTLTRREQAYLLVMGFVLGLWLLFQLVLNPLADQRDQMALNNVAVRELLTRVDAKVAQLQMLRAEGGQRNDNNLTTVISRSADKVGLPIRRIQPNSRGEVQVRFESVDYDTFLTWLHGIEVNAGVTVLDASVGQASRRGGINATLRLAGSR